MAQGRHLHNAQVGEHRGVAGHSHEDRDLPTHEHEHYHGADDEHHHVVGHAHAPASYGRAFALGIGLNSAFVVAEVVYGVMAGSLALVADAGHNVSDVLALLLAWWATVLCRRAPTERHTYGWRRSSILVALANAVALFVVIGGVAWEAVHLLGQPAPVQGATIIVVAAVGVFINGASALLFMSGRSRDMNLRGAFLHLAADAAVSLGVVIVGFAIVATGWLWLDPAVSLLIGVVILLSTWGLLRDSLNLALDAVPEGIDMGEVRAFLTALPGVVDVHDLHVWAMSTTETALTVHIVVSTDGACDDLLAFAVHELREDFGIGHPTLQVEWGKADHRCTLATVRIA